MANKRQDSGRTKTVGVRLDPKLKYAAELAARKQRRSLSSFIEWAVQEAVDQVPMASVSGLAPSTPWKVMHWLWDVSPSTRLVKLAINFSGLLTYDEQVLWHLIREHPAMWRGKRDTKGRSLPQVRKDQANNFRFDLLEEHFETFEQVARGELDKKALEKIKPST